MDAQIINFSLNTRNEGFRATIFRL